MPRTTKIRGGNGNWFSRKFGSFKQLFRGRAARRDAELQDALHRQNWRRQNSPEDAMRDQPPARQQPHRSGMFSMFKRPNAVEAYHEAVQALDNAKEYHMKLKEHHKKLKADAKSDTHNPYMATMNEDQKKQSGETLLLALNNAEDAYTKAWNESARAHKAPPQLKHGYAWIPLNATQTSMSSIKNLVKKEVEDFDRSHAHESK